jgi:hypothetical protein
MGYTHYFSYSPHADCFREAWPQIVTDTQRIVNHITGLGIPLAGPDGNGSPEITEKGIKLNGQKSGAYEALMIWPHPPTIHDDAWQAFQYDKRRFVWDFCKTSRQPYDVAVSAILLRCHQLAPDAFVIASDGGWDDEWRHGAFPGTVPAGVSARRVVEDLFTARTDRSPLDSDPLSGPPSLDPA